MRREEPHGRIIVCRVRESVQKINGFGCPRFFGVVEEEGTHSGIWVIGLIDA